jgi:Cu/Ag efflux protein CusF
MKRLALCALLFSLASAGALAQALTDGEVQRIDKANGRITLKHEEIKNLDMPPMTMVFQVKDPALLEKARVGEKVKFRAEKDGKAYVVTAIEKAK